jgi:hypothetical protein
MDDDVIANHRIRGKGQAHLLDDPTEIDATQALGVRGGETDDLTRHGQTHGATLTETVASGLTATGDGPVDVGSDYNSGICAGLKLAT